jgi:hypothetical protein
MSWASELVGSTLQVKARRAAGAVVALGLVGSLVVNSAPAAVASGAVFHGLSKGVSHRPGSNRPEAAPAAPKPATRPRRSTSRHPAHTRRDPFTRSGRRSSKRTKTAAPAHAAAASTPAAPTNSGSLSLILAKPAGTQPGDAMLGAVVGRHASSVTPPSGWTFIRSDGKVYLYVKVAGPAEPSTYTWSLSNATVAVGMIVSYGGVTATPIEGSSGKKQTSTSEIRAPSLSTTDDDSMVVGFFAINRDTSIALSNGLTDRGYVDASGSDGAALRIGDFVQPQSGATGDKTATAGKSSTTVGQLVALQPAQPGGIVYRAFEDTSYWNQPLPRSAPVDPNSSDIISFLQTDSTTDYVQMSGTTSSGLWGNPVYWASAKDEAYAVANQTGCSSPPPEFDSVRIPKGANPDGTSDASMTVYDLSSGLVYAMWKATYTASTDSWSSCGGTVYYVGSNGLAGSLPQSDEPRNQGHRGIPPSSFAVRYDEIQAGEIDHVLKIAVNTTQCEHVFPMTGDECGTTAQFAPPEGTRIRIKPSVDLSKLGLSPSALIVAQALQTYGAVIGDQSSGPVALKVENVVAEGQGNLWDGLLKSTSLSAIPLSDYEVILLGWAG